jgi:hypothetical protein
MNVEEVRVWKRQFWIHYIFREMEQCYGKCQVRIFDCLTQVQVPWIQACNIWVQKCAWSACDPEMLILY